MKKFLITCICISGLASAQQNPATLFIGTYTDKCESKGIYVYDFNLVNGSAQLRSTTTNIDSPSYFTISEDRKYLYSVNENGENSKVSAFSFNKINRKLTLLNQQQAGGADPCYIITDAACVITANYSGGNLSVFKKNGDGSIDKASQIIRFSGNGPDTTRQKSPHAHMVEFTPDQKHVISTDLGTDKLRIYSYNPAAEKNILAIVDSVQLKPGSGPRHLTFSKNGKFLYVLGELDGSILTLKYDDGKLQQIQETTIVENPDIKIGAADIKISSDGKFLYATNRGDANTISTFQIADDGTLDKKQTISTLGKSPRNFTIDPSGKMLLVANQHSNEVVVFNRNVKSGMLTDSGKRIKVCQPVCLVFANR